MNAVATSIGVEIKNGIVRAEGDLDFRGTLGVAKDAPVGFAQIRLTFAVDTDAPQEKLDQLLKLTERYCVVYQTIKSGPPIEVKLGDVREAVALGADETGKVTEDGLVSIATTSCTGLCDQGPGMLVNGRAIARLDPQRVAETLAIGASSSRYPK